MIDQWIDSISLLISETFWLAPLLSLVAGIVTSLTPCSLTSIPLIIGYVDGTGKHENGRAFRFSAVFAVGMAVTYISLGAFASVLGEFLYRLGLWWHVLLGALMVLMALQVLEIINLVPSALGLTDNRRRGYGGAFIAGLLGGLFASHCALPVLVVILAIVAEHGDIAWGLLLLLLFSVGHSVLVVVAGTSVGFMNMMTGSKNYSTLIQGIKIALGVVILLLAAYMFYLAFSFTGEII